MSRKIELHLDALIVIVLVFAAAVGFIAYQRHQYSLLLQDNVERQFKQMTMELEIARLKILLERASKGEAGAPRAEKSVEQGKGGK